MPESLPSIWDSAQAADVPPPTLIYRAQLDGAVRFCIHGLADCPGPQADVYDQDAGQTWLPRTDPAAGVSEYRMLYFLPDGSASDSFEIALRTNDGRAAAVRIEQLDGRVVMPEALQ